MKLRDYLNEKVKDAKGNTLRVGDWVSFNNRDFEIVDIAWDNIRLEQKIKLKSGYSGGVYQNISKRLSKQLEQIDRPH